MIRSHCKKPGDRGQNPFARNRSIGKSIFFAREHAWYSLHRMNHHDNSTYIAPRIGSKHGPSRQPYFGQQNGQQNFDSGVQASNTIDKTSSTAMGAYHPAAYTASATFTTAVSQLLQVRVVGLLLARPLGRLLYDFQKANTSCPTQHLQSTPPPSQPTSP